MEALPKKIFQQRTESLDEFIAAVDSEQMTNVEAHTCWKETSPDEENSRY